MARFSFHDTDIEGLVLFERRPIGDDRGSFERLYCPEEFSGPQAHFPLSQLNLSKNHRAGTLRGMHFQRAPHDESKLVQVLSGAIYDVVADLRDKSSSFGHWQAFELSEENARGLIVPSGCAHGFLTLRDASSVLYGMDRMFQDGVADGFRYDDPALNIQWPSEPKIISPKDANWPRLELRQPN